MQRNYPKRTLAFVQQRILMACGLLSVLWLLVSLLSQYQTASAKVPRSPTASASSTTIHQDQYNEQALSTPPGASVSMRVAVPSTMRTSPFDVERYLNVPPNFSISVYARIGNARFMAIAPNGDLLVSQPGAGKVLLVRSQTGGDPVISDFVTGLRKPHDIVFHTIGATTYVYIAETHQINRFIYNLGDTTAHDRQVVITGLPDSSTPELQGAYGHELKNIALDANHKLYVSIASTCNACLSDTTSNPVRGAIYQYDADGNNRRLFAQGLRNAEGLAFVPGTNDLWVVVNNRDEIRYPFNDSTGQYGRVIPAYVDNHPPEEFTRVRDGGNYGWPFCNPNPDTAGGLDNMPFDRDYEFNQGGQVNCDAMDRISKGIQAHSAALGLTFLHNTLFPSLYRQGAVTGLHGSWNRQQRTGYKVAYFAMDNVAQTPGNQIDLVSGWLNSATQDVWGRPVDAVVDQEGNLLISDDYSGTIYKLSYGVQTPFYGTTFTVPGTIQAEDFDNGGEGVAYHDSGSGNIGGQYRNTDVDIERSNDVGGGYNVGWMEAAEWLKYSINVGTAGSYTIEARIASNGGGARFHVEFDGVDKTGLLTAPNTGNYQVYQTVTKSGVSLNAGPQVMRVVMDSVGPNGASINLNHLKIGTASTLTYYEIVARHSGKVLDVSGYSNNNGAVVTQWDHWGGANQQWRLEDVGGGYYAIVARHSGKALDVSGFSNNNGAVVTQWDYWGGANQQWQLTDVGGGYYRITARHSGKVLDVSGYSNSNGAVVTQWDYWGGANQQWQLRAIP